MQKARRHPTKGLRPLVSVWFQKLLTSLRRILFTFPSRYLFTIGLSGVFSLTGWCRQIQRGFHLPPPTQDTTTSLTLTFTGFSPSMTGLPKPFNFKLVQILWSYNPEMAATTSVWAPPLSLATTQGITVVFFSSGYLDVSVPRVRLLTDSISSRYWVAPFGNLRINM